MRELFFNGVEKTCSRHCRWRLGLGMDSPEQFGLAVIGGPKVQTSLELHEARRTLEVI